MTERKELCNGIIRPASGGGESRGRACTASDGR